MSTTFLYRPVGLFELKLIEESAYSEFPPRLPEQPIFYPVLNAEYARQIAKDWNTKDEKSGYMGVITRFKLANSYILQFQEQIVGNATHRELWVPAEELSNFNQQIIGKIEVIESYYGEKFEGAKLW